MAGTVRFGPVLVPGVLPHARTPSGEATRDRRASISARQRLGSRRPHGVQPSESPPA